MALLEETRNEGGNLVIRMWDPAHNIEACTIINTQAAAYADQSLFGLPVTNLTRVNDNVWSADLVLAAGQANVEGIIISNGIVDFAATGGAGDETTKRYKVMARGPCVINKNQIRATDPAGAAYNRDTIAAALSALGITVRAETDRSIDY